MENAGDARPAAETPGGAAPEDDAPPPAFATRLAEAGKMLRSGAPAESPVAAIARALLVVSEADHAAIFFRSPTGVVTCPWSHNLSEQYVAELATPDGVNPWIHILRHPELTCMDLPKTRRRVDPSPWIVPDVLALSSDHAALLDRFVRENLRAMFVWPLSRDGRVTAALACYYDTPHECAEEEQQTMRAFAAQATAVLGEDPSPAGGPVRRDTQQAPGAGWPRRAPTGPAVADRPATPAQPAAAAEAAGRAAERAALEADAHRLAGEREKLAAARQELETAQAHAAEARRRIAAEQQQVADERGRLTEAQRSHAAERDRLAGVQRQVEVERVRLAEARAAFDAERARHEGDGERLTAARTEAASEETRLAADRTRLHEEHTRLETLRRDLEAQGVRLAGDRAALEADTRRFADSQAVLAAEKDRLAETRRALEAEAVRLSAERRALDAERAQPAAPPGAADAAPAKDRQFTGTEEKRVPPVHEVEPGATTYADLVGRVGVANVSDIDKQIVAVARHLDAHNGHIADYGKRLAEWAEALARALRCSDQDVASTRRAALLHDIGKIDVPAATLKKATAPTDDELGMIRQEPAIAHQMLKDADGLNDVATILRHRFERWDGAGHPDRLTGKAIPLGARVLAVVDAYGEMITGRPGVPKLYYRDAIAGLQRESGTRFDPDVAAAFCRIVARG